VTAAQSVLESFDQCGRVLFARKPILVHLRPTTSNMRRLYSGRSTRILTKAPSKNLCGPYTGDLGVDKAAREECQQSRSEADAGEKTACCSLLYGWSPDGRAARPLCRAPLHLCVGLDWLFASPEIRPQPGSRRSMSCHKCKNTSRNIMANSALSKDQIEREPYWRFPGLPHAPSRNILKRRIMLSALPALVGRPLRPPRGRVQSP
jgi:hypothetical protein